MSTVDSTSPVQSDGWNRFVAGRATCSVNDQVGDATYGQDTRSVEWYVDVELKSHVCRCVVVTSSHRLKYRNASMREWGDGTVKSDRSAEVAYFIISDSVVPSDSKQLSQTLLMESITMHTIIMLDAAYRNRCSVVCVCVCCRPYIRRGPRSAAWDGALFCRRNVSTCPGLPAAT